MAAELNMRVYLFVQTIRPQEACEAVGVNALDIATTARRALSTFVRVLLRPSRLAPVIYS